MPGRFFLERSNAEIARLFAVPEPQSPVLPRRNIAPGQDVIVCTDAGKLASMRWGMIPVGRVNARGRPVMETIVNARSETLFEKTAFQGVARCLVPADGWYEWTGAVRKKKPWRITRKDGEPIVFAAICDNWRAPNGTVLKQFATVTCAPNGELREIHDRMGVIIQQPDFMKWLHGSKAEAARLMLPLPDGALAVEEAIDVDWQAP